jgi:hypothetical protein
MREKAVALPALRKPLAVGDFSLDLEHADAWGLKAVRMAAQNPGWGYTRIQRALKNLGHSVARSTVAKVLKDNGIPPASDRPSSWRMFLPAHRGAIVGADFFTSEVWTPRGLVTYYTLLVRHNAVGRGRGGSTHVTPATRG